MTSKPRRTAFGMASQIVQKTAETMAKEQQVIDEVINEELQTMNVVDIQISDLYSAPAKWNEWSKLSEEKLLQLCDSIIQVGQQAPCVVWKINKQTVQSLYDSGEQDTYGFTGEKYMILSGHNRCFARKLIGETEEYKDVETYKSVPCVIYEEPLSDDFVKKAQQIIDDTNYLSRDNTPKEIMRAITKKYELYSSQTRRTHSVADSIAKSLNLNKRTVFRYTKLRDDLLPSILDLVFEEKISFNDATEISNFSPEIQNFIATNYKEILTNKKELKRLLKNSTPDMTIQEITELLCKEEPKSKYEKITVSVPEELVEEFKEMFKKWKRERVTHVTSSDTVSED